MASTIAHRISPKRACVARRRRRHVLRQRWDALVNATLVIVGSQILIVGAGLQLNVISMRRAVEHQRLGRLVVWIFEARGRLSHLHAQELELLVALLGAACIAAGVTREVAAWHALSARKRRAPLVER